MNKWLNDDGRFIWYPELWNPPPDFKLKNKKYMEKTIGEIRVRTEFNPDKNDVVDQIKQKTAELINLCETLKAKDGRLASVAQTQYEDAAMWAVKAATA